MRETRGQAMGMKRYSQTERRVKKNAWKVNFVSQRTQVWRCEGFVPRRRDASHVEGSCPRRDNLLLGALQ